MNTMLHWSPTRQFHLHHEADDLFERFFYGTRDEPLSVPRCSPP